MCNFEREMIIVVPNNIFIYWVKIPDGLSSIQLQDRLDLLDTEERATYYSYKVDFKKIEFFVGRCIAKIALSQILHVNPNDISFIKNEFGKLYVNNQSLKPYFNLSHTDEMVVCAVSADSEMGIDVERTLTNHLEVMEHVFVPSEIDWVNTQGDMKARMHAFYMLWTRKEALMKAVGKGFSLSPLSFEVPFKEEQAYNHEFRYYTFEPMMDYILSVATKLLPLHLHKFEVHEVMFSELMAGNIQFISCDADT